MLHRNINARSHRQRGRPRTNQAIEQLIVRLARENRDWGNLRAIASKQEAGRG
jgi:hypothetical protein